jgi:ABC-type dipeptide/oligopeptide/nickel transport system permease component
VAEKLGAFIAKTAIRLFATYVIVLIAYFVVVRVFPVLILGPGADPVLIVLKKGAEDPRFGDWAIQAAMKYGYNKTMIEQLGIYLVNTLTFDFGVSLFTQRPVLEDIAIRLPYTLSVYTAATILPIVIGYELGIISAKHRGGKLDSIILQLGTVSRILPAWLILLLLYYFLAYLPKRLWGAYVFPLPVKPPSFDFSVDPIGSLKYFLWYITPMLLAAVIAWSGGWIYYIRQLVVSELGQDYVITALAKGLDFGETLKKHVIRNVRPPLVLSLAYTLPGIFGGAYIFEIISNWPGIASFSVNATLNWDWPVMVAFFAISTLLTVISLFVAEIILAIIDPRVRTR